MEIKKMKEKSAPTGSFSFSFFDLRKKERKKEEKKKGYQSFSDILQ